MKAGLGNLMRQAQKMQEDLKTAQDELASTEVTGEAGGGMVSVTLTCKYGVRRVSIDNSLVGDDKEMLEDLVAAAFNSAVRKVEQTVRDKMAGLTAGVGLPPGINLPF
ncbi:MAG: YbaB/EbfC family nucleoid-associated protein [Gammaproteobacteria bacterium]